METKGDKLVRVSTLILIIYFITAVLFTAVLLIGAKLNSNNMEAYGYILVFGIAGLIFIITPLFGLLALIFTILGFKKITNRRFLVLFNLIISILLIFSPIILYFGQFFWSLISLNQLDSNITGIK